jgi:hypothetical protein
MPGTPRHHQRRIQNAVSGIASVGTQSTGRQKVPAQRVVCIPGVGLLTVEEALPVSFRQRSAQAAWSATYAQGTGSYGLHWQQSRCGHVHRAWFLPQTPEQQLPLRPQTSPGLAQTAPASAGTSRVSPRAASPPSTERRVFLRARRVAIAAKRWLCTAHLPHRPGRSHVHRMEAMAPPAVPGCRCLSVHG